MELRREEEAEEEDEEDTDEVYMPSSTRTISASFVISSYRERSPPWGADAADDEFD